MLGILKLQVLVLLVQKTVKIIILAWIAQMKIHVLLVSMVTTNKTDNA